MNKAKYRERLDSAEGAKPAESSTNATLTGEVRLALADEAAEGEAKKDRRFSILAYSGAVVERFWGRFVIRLDGMKAKDRFPVLRQHNHEKIVGWADAHGVDKSGLQVKGKFSRSTPDALEVLNLADEGFPWQASIGVEALRVISLERGQKEKVNGYQVEGPIDIWDESNVYEVSFVPLGADSNTEARIDASKHEEMKMNEKLRALLKALGLKDNATDAEALAFLSGLGLKKDATEAEMLAFAEALARQREEAANNAAPGKSETPPAEPNAPVLSAADLERARQEERDRISAIADLADQFGLDPKTRKELLGGNLSIHAARERVLAELAKNNPRLNWVNMEEGENEGDKFRATAVQGIMQRLGYKPTKDEKPRAGVDEFHHLGLQGMARLCVERAGYNVRAMSNQQIAETILIPRVRLSLSTSDFSGIYLDAINKILLAGYNEQPATWRPVVNIISASDFKEIYGIQLSAGPDLRQVDEGDEYTYGELKDSKEKLHVNKYGRIIAITWEMLVNDDLSALMRIPRMFGPMAARNQANVIYSKLTGSVIMSDGNELFSAAHKNLAASGSALTSASLDVAYQAVTQQRGLQNEALDIYPRFLLVPPSLRTTALVILNSSAQPVAQMSSGVVNVWQDSGIVPIVEARLETGAGQPKPWWLLADPGMANVIDVAFLDGKEEPDVIEHEEFNRDVIAFKVRNVFGAGAMDWRGGYKNPGAAL